MNSIQQAWEFYKSIGKKILNNISFKNLVWKIILWIILLVLVNYFPNTAINSWWVIQDIMHIVLIINIIAIVWKIIYNIYQYKTNIFNTEEEKRFFKINNIKYIKEAMYGFLEISLSYFIITFVFNTIDIIFWDITPAIDLFWLWFVALTLFTIMCLDANIIIISNLMNKYKKAYIINYILFPIIFLLMIILYLHIIY